MALAVVGEQRENLIPIIISMLPSFGFTSGKEQCCYDCRLAFDAAVVEYIEASVANTKRSEAKTK